jgi:hypothetical protein
MRKRKIILFISTSILFICSILFFAFSTNEIELNESDNGCRFSNIDLHSGKQTVNTNVFILPHDEFDAQFPFEIYIESQNWKSTKSLIKDLKFIDSLGIPDYVIDNVISEALTTHLKKRWNTLSLDSLHAIVAWATPFFYYGQSGQEHAILFQTIGDYWLGNVSEKLQDIVDKDDYAYINCRYKYLRMRTCHLVGSCGDKLPDSVKLINNFGESRWGYLWERFWTHTSKIQKSVILILFISNFYLLFFFLKSKFKKNNQ